MCVVCIFFFFKQKTAYEMRISDWSSDVCSSDLSAPLLRTILKNIFPGERAFSSSASWLFSDRPNLTPSAGWILIQVLASSMDRPVQNFCNQPRRDCLSALDTRAAHVDDLDCQYHPRAPLLIQSDGLLDRQECVNKC